MQSSSKSNRAALSLLLPILLFTGTAAAWGRPNPEPPPSGIVIHLFGPNSITSTVLPGVRTGATATRHAGASAGAEVSGDGGGSEPAVSTAEPRAADDPTLGQALHQMFVVGDPDQKPGARIPLGRSADRPKAFNK